MLKIIATCSTLTDGQLADELYRLERLDGKLRAIGHPSFLVDRAVAAVRAEFDRRTAERVTVLEAMAGARWALTAALLEAWR